MPSRRSQLEMSPEEVEAFLEEQTILNIATIGPDGDVHLVPMWFYLENGRPTLWTFGKSQKIANLRRSSRITALAESGDTYAQLRGVELVGEADLIEDHDHVVRIGRALISKYEGASAAEGPAGALIEQQARKRTGITINVRRVVSWDHRKIQGY